MQTPCSYVTKAVETKLKSISIPGIKREEIYVLPEGRVPASAGQKSIIISPSAITTENTNLNYRAKVVGFRVHLIQRVRDIPPDRFGLIYTDPNETHEIHDVIVDAVQSLDMFRSLNTLINTTQDSSELQLRYSLVKTFIHRITILTPIHLYPGYFHSKSSEHDATLAGYKTYSSFTSPSFYLSSNPLSC
jgi:hypothetical protein